MENHKPCVKMKKKTNFVYSFIKMFRIKLLKTDMGSKRFSVPYHPEWLGTGGSDVAK